MNERSTLEVEEKKKIAIISANCRFPGSNSLEEFWNTLLQNNKENQENIFKSSRQNENCLDDLENQVNFLKCRVDEFDAELFNVTANKAVLLDPQQRLLMELTWEALEKACINPQSLRGSSTGVFIGAWSIDYEKVIANSSLAGSREFHVGYISSSYGALSSHIAYILGLNAKHATIDRGPASSLFTLEKACKSLERGECNLAIAAAVNLILFPRLGQTEKMPESSFIWKKSSEGCAVVILKRLSDAIIDKDDILGIIRSVGICTDAAEGNFGDVSQKSIEKAIGKSHSIAGIEANEISYVELQGKENVERGVIESIYVEKGNSDIFFECVADAIGNAESTAGFASLVKILLSFKHEIIPSAFPKLWPKSTSRKRYAAINSYGYGNECAHLTLEEPPGVRSDNNGHENSRKLCNVLIASASSATALENLSENYKNFIETTKYDISDICFTANTCRAQLTHRMAIHGHSKQDIVNLIHDHKFLSGTIGKPKIAFLFNSHNNFTFNLLSKQFYENNLQFKEALDKCAEIFQQKNSKYSLSELLWEQIATEKEKQKYLLPITFSVQYSLTELFRSFGISADAVLGYSTGEFSAAVDAGILTLSDVLKFLLQTCQEDHLNQHLTLISVGTSKPIVEKLLSFYSEENSQVDPSELNIFAINSNDEVLIESKSQTIAEEFVKLCLEETVQAKILSSYRHILNFSKISPKLFQDLQQATTNSSTLNCTYVSGCTGRILTNIDSKLSPGIVNFAEGFKTLWLQGCRIFIDIGSNAGLIRLAKLNISQTQAASCAWGSTLSSHEDNLCTLASLLSKLFVAGFNINWKTFYENSCSKKVQIPTYAFQKQRFWPTSN